MNLLKNLLLLCLPLLLTDCAKKQEIPKASSIQFLKENPAILQPQPFAMDSKAILIQGARIMTASGQTLPEGHLLMEAGRIKKISKDPIDTDPNTTIIDGKGLTLTPGLIDIHSHMGVYPSPHVDAHMDGNEMVDPVTANVWAEHGFWPQDPDLWRAMAGGITTIQVLPGSGNLIGGRSFVAKLLPKLSAREMRFPGAKQGLKMACGENPKRVYKDKGLMTRMGNVAGYRKAYQEAIEYARQWQEYEKNPEKEKMPKRNFVSETLVHVLNGDILVHFHCYRADDISAILDVAKEFGFKIRSIHHGLEAYKIADRLAAEGVGVATWADWWGFKAEAYDGIPYNIALLEKAGAKAIIHSDSATDVRFLNIEAAKALSSARKLGLEFTEDQALAWVTKNPAWALGLDNEIGTLTEGKMADVVAWDRHPFSVYAKPQYVFINGKKVLDRKEQQRLQSDFEVGINDSDFFDGRQFNPAPNTQQIQWGDKELKSSKLISQNFLLEKTKAFINSEWKENVSILVKNGRIQQINPKDVPKKIERIDGEHKILTPGFIESQSSLGLYDIALDSSAQDLRANPLSPTPDFKAVDALNTLNTRVANKRQEGITTALSHLSGGIAASKAVAFDLKAHQILKPEVALFGRFDKIRSAKKSRSALWSDLRQFLDDAQLYLKNPKIFDQGDSRPTVVASRQLAAMAPVLSGQIPWVVQVHRADDISRLLNLKTKHPKIRFIITGATEAWLVADDLKTHRVPVILTPSAQTPQNFDKLQARFDQAAYLQQKGVEIVIADNNDNGAGRTRQEAGLAVKYGLKHEEALKAITETPAKIFQLPRGQIKIGAPANLVLWNADPLEPTSWAEKIWIQGQQQPIKNRHRQLAEKYLMQ